MRVMINDEALITEDRFHRECKDIRMYIQERPYSMPPSIVTLYHNVADGDLDEVILLVDRDCGNVRCRVIHNYNIPDGDGRDRFVIFDKTLSPEKCLQYDEDNMSDIYTFLYCMIRLMEY